MKTTLISLLTILLISNEASAVFQLEEDHSLPVAYINLVLDRGSVHDPKNKSGLANVATEMLLRGTQKKSKDQFNDLLNLYGAQIDTEVKADAVIFRIASLSSKLPLVLQLFEEALTRPRFSAEELARLKKEIKGQILEQRGKDSSLAWYHFQKYFFEDHPFGNSAIGTLKGIDSIQAKDVIEFYSSSFGKSTLHFFGTGDVAKSTMNEWFEGLLEKLHAVHPGVSPAKPVAEFSLKPGRRILIIDKPKATQSQMLLGGSGARPEDPGFYDVQLANHAFGGSSFQAKLMKELRVKRGWTYGTSNRFQFGKARRYYAIYAGPKNADTAPAIDLSLNLLLDFKNNGITREEFESAKRSLVNNAPFDFDTPKKRVENQTNEFILGFENGFFSSLAKNYEKVVYEKSLLSVKDFFQPDNLVLVVVGDAATLKEPLSQLPGFAKPIVKSYRED